MSLYIKTRNGILYIFCTLLVLSCQKESSFIEEAQPTDLLTIEETYSTPKLVETVLANLYNRQIDFSSVKDWPSMLGFGDSFSGENGPSGIITSTSFGYGTWFLWDYGYIRHLNLFLERLTHSTSFSGTDEQRRGYLAEARFLRANYYFEIVKRVGGVPLILESLSYDLKGDPTHLQFPRSKEHEVYDFIIKELEEVKDVFVANESLKDKPSKAAVLALVSRAALYAGSIAKYGANTPSVALPGNEIGIPAGMADGYYQKALTAAQSIINKEVGNYELYLKTPTDLSQNFAALFYDKGSNPEIIWMEDFRLQTDKRHGFTVNCQPFYRAEDIDEGGALLPSYNIVQEFEKLDNSFAPFSVKDAANNTLYYTDPLELFAGRDARLHGTVITPGASFKSNRTDIWAGYKLADGTVISATQPGGMGNIPNGPEGVQLVGYDGPIETVQFVARSGFYIRKFLDPSQGSGQRLTGSAVPNIRIRYAEVLLNAAEAAFELGQPDLAVGFINQVRRRAGFTTDLTSAQMTFDRIVHERRVELAFEGHVLYDNKRWRIAHQVWDGITLSETDLLSGIGTATKRNTQPYSLLPYKYHNPGNPNHGKYLFEIRRANIVTGVVNFRMGNYYSQIPDDFVARNPKLVKQPNQ